MNTHRQVGKISANWNSLFANWIQLADPCQLHSHVNQPLERKLASWQVAVGWSVVCGQFGQVPKFKPRPFMHFAVDGDAVVGG